MAIRNRPPFIDLTNDSSDDDSSPEGLQDINNYLAIGTLVLPAAAAEHIQTWDEVSSVEELPDLSATLAFDIEKLLSHGRIRIFAAAPSRSLLRVYVLPNDVGHRYVQHDRKLDGHFFTLLSKIDVSPNAWSGYPTDFQPFGLHAASEDGSLYYLFNHIPSPNPKPENIKSYFHRAALSELLDPESQLLGLKTTLYPYQRRSAGGMLEREREERLELDPRLEERVAVDGSKYYYSPWDIGFFVSPRFYETCKGGILAETMGLGKTVICIALILATRSQLPQVPAQYDQPLTRPKTASLVDMTVSAIHRHSAPWRTSFDRHEERTEEYMGQCIKLMRNHVPSYEIPTEPIRWSRNTITPPPRKLTLAATTIIVVPRNLLSQWKSEFEKHTEPGSLKILVADDNKIDLPSPFDLATYDVVLFSRPRFEHEARDGSDTYGRRMSRNPVACSCPYIGASRTRDCTCIRNDEIYSSPLKSLHFLRIIIDEGHGMAAENTRIASVASNLVQASHRWVVSGTPAKDLIGVEMDLVGPVSHSASPAPFDNNNECDSQYNSGLGSGSSDAENDRRVALLDQRKTFIAKDERDGAIRNIGSMASNFLQIRPWCSGDGERAAEWSDHVFRHEMTRPRMRTFSGFSRCLRRILESIVIRTQPADVDRDIELPPLSHTIIRLEPSFYDKLTVNAFVFVLTANAITSERTDVDYIFHKNSGKERSQLLANLRTSAFYWTGFSATDMESAIDQSKKYLEKPDRKCSLQDEELLRKCISQANIMVNSKGWRSLTKTHEVGLYLNHWPAGSLTYWSFNKVRPDSPLLCGTSQLISAQDHVNNNIALEIEDPSEGLPGVGLRALSSLRSTPIDNANVGSTLVKAGIPSSSLASDQLGQRKPSLSAAQSKHPASPSLKRRGSDAASLNVPSAPEVRIPEDSPLRETSIIGTTSAKLSYLLSRIETFHRDEKILVFYDSENTAFYIAQVLEVLHIDYLIYAKSLTPALKSEYVVRFNQNPKHRVLLMDIGQAAYGLNFPCASKIFFINPVNRPHDQAQALKRAHRIGQTREVHAETLILKGTIEEKIFERARNMSRSEHKDAKELDDDGGIRQIIQSAEPLPVSTAEAKGFGPVAFLEEAKQFFARPGWGSWKQSVHENSRTGTAKQVAKPGSSSGDNDTSKLKKTRRSKPRARPSADDEGGSSRKRVRRR